MQLLELVVQECINRIEQNENTDSWTITRDMVFHNIVTEWRDHRQKSIRAQIQQLEFEWETVTGWKWLKQTVIT